jgi:hypothetical protein
MSPQDIKTWKASVFSNASVRTSNFMTHSSTVTKKYTNTLPTSYFLSDLIKTDVYAHGILGVILPLYLMLLVGA